mgnify:CR=1 FL=1
MLVRWSVDGPEHKAFKMHQERVIDYLWYVWNLIEIESSAHSYNCTELPLCTKGVLIFDICSTRIWHNVL